MTTETLATLLFVAGWAQLSVLVASALVPIRLNWQEEFKSLSPLHRQMYWVYGGYVVLSIVALVSRKRCLSEARWTALRPVPLDCSAATWAAAGP